MTVIDIHTHIIPRFVIEEARQGAGAFGMTFENDVLAHSEGFRYPVTKEFFEPGAKLSKMMAMGIDVSMVSCPPTLFFYHHRGEEAVKFARRCNDGVAEFVSASDRLYGVATLPLQDPKEAVRELERAVSILGLVGVHLGISCDPGSRPLDSPDLKPVLAQAERLGTPLLLHPYYLRPRELLEEFYFMNSIGHPLDTCVAAARLIHSGTLDAFPELKVVLFHGGGYLPYQLGRLDHAYLVRDEPKANISRPPSEYIDRFWMDSITHSDQALIFLASLIRSDRLVVGTDLPFDMGEINPRERLERASLDAAVLGNTASDLFGLELEVISAR